MMGLATPKRKKEVPKTMRFAVVGVGDYGSRYAARLIASGEDVTLIARGRTLERLKTEGIDSTQSTGFQEMRVEEVNATDDCASVGPVDVVLMCVKLYQLDDAMETASSLVGPDTAVLGFQNGLTGEDRLIARYGADRVVGVGTGVASVPVSIGELPRGKSIRTNAIVQVFNEAGINVVEHENVNEAIWLKFIRICGGSVTALSRLPIGEVAKIP
jgi:2-dehydropantoate 2-reductase